MKGFPSDAGLLYTLLPGPVSKYPDHTLKSLRSETDFIQADILVASMFHDLQVYQNTHQPRPTECEVSCLSNSKA